jgi:hypothetical protein
VIAKYDVDHKSEKSRNMKILGHLQRAEDYKHAGGNKSKADSNMDVDKMVRNQVRKE